MDRTFPKKLNHYQFFEYRWSEPQTAGKRFHYSFNDPLWIKVKKHISEINNKYDIGMDLGSGDGRMSIDIANMFHRFIFVDKSNKAIDLVIYNYQKRYNQKPNAYQLDLSMIKTKKKNIDGYDELIGNVDFIILSHVIHYLSKGELKNILNEIRALLKKGGQCYLGCEANIKKILPANPKNYKYFEFELEINHTVELFNKLINDFNFTILETCFTEKKPFKISIPKVFFDKHMKTALGFNNGPIDSSAYFYSRKFDLIEIYFKKR